MNQVTGNNDELPKGDYAFFIDQRERRDEGEVNLTIGGVQVQSVLIDSGSTCNFVHYEIWNYLKQSHVDLVNRTRNYLHMAKETQLML